MSYIVFVILFLSLRACTGRSLGLLTGKSDIPGKDVHNSKMYSTLPNIKLQHSETQELQEEENYSVESGLAKILEISASAIFEGKASEATLNGEPTKGWRRQTLSTHDAEESIDSNENDIVEDVVVMDYAVPRRKPPIHNTKS